MQSNLPKSWKQDTESRNNFSLSKDRCINNFYLCQTQIATKELSHSSQGDFLARRKLWYCGFHWLVAVSYDLSAFGETK